MCRAVSITLFTLRICIITSDASGDCFFSGERSALVWFYRSFARFFLVLNLYTVRFQSWPPCLRARLRSTAAWHPSRSHRSQHLHPSPGTLHNSMASPLRKGFMVCSLDTSSAKIVVRCDEPNCMTPNNGCGGSRSLTPSRMKCLQSHCGCAANWGR